MILKPYGIFIKIENCLLIEALGLESENLNLITNLLFISCLFLNMFIYKNKEKFNFL